MGQDVFMQYSGRILAALAAWIVLRCARSMLAADDAPEVWAYLSPPKGERIPVAHWECLVGRSGGADAVIDDPAAAGTHALLQRSSAGGWSVTDLSRGTGVLLNGRAVEGTAPIKSGDRLRIGKTTLRFTAQDVPRRDSPPRRRPASSATLLLLTLFELTLLLQHCFTAAAADRPGIILSFGILASLQWGGYFIERYAGARGFEPETLAFLLTAAGFSVAASSVPENMLKQSALFVLALTVFFLLGLWLRELKRVTALRAAAAAAAIALLGLTLVTSESVMGAKNWLTVAGSSLQPSEFVKIAYVYAGAASLDRCLQMRRTLLFTVFSAVCVGALALMGDFGTALVFFTAFLVIVFLRSGNPLMLGLPLAAAAAAVALVLTLRPYVAQRFASWGHVWEDPLGAGYQQVRAMSALASGGLFGRGAGGGWLTSVVAADTDLVFGVVCEELGLVTGVCCMAGVLLLALFAWRRADTGRSSYYVIAACAAAAVFLAQMGLNVFGSMDLLPFTGVTFPFVSRGGSSLIACWGLLAFLKAADTRPGGSFALGRTVASKTPAGGGKPAAAKSAAAPDAKKDAKKPAAGKSGRSGQAGKRAARAETKKKGAGR